MRLSIIAGLICITLAALAVACGGGDDKASSTPVSSVVTTAAGGSHTAKATATKKPTTTPKKTTSGATSANQDYFTRLEAYFDDSRSRTDDATSTLDTDLAAATTLDEEKQAINTFLNTMVGVFDDAIATMDELNPPSEAKDPHDTFRNDIAQAKDISQGLKSDISHAATQAAAQAVVDDFNNRVNTLVNDAQAACRDLQTIADDQNANVDLQCKSA